jgi:hypothetical protein
MYYMAIWYILRLFGIFSCFGILYREKSGNPDSRRPIKMPEIKVFIFWRNVLSPTFSLPNFNFVWTGVDVMIAIFCDFRQFSANKLAFFSKANLMIIFFLQKLVVVWARNANFFANFLANKKNHNIGPCSDSILDRWRRSNTAVGNWQG